MVKKVRILFEVLQYLLNDMAATEKGTYRPIPYATLLTRSQAVARIADHTASQHLRVRGGSRDVIGHVTI